MAQALAGGVFERFGIVWSLVRRDYAVQFAGTALGLVWLVARYAIQTAVFFFVFGWILRDRIPGAPADYLAYLLGGMSFWLPFSEMLVRSSSILVDNRSLIRRTSVGPGVFLWIVPVQALLHYAILFLLVSMGLLFRGTLSWAFPLSFLWGCFFILCFSGWGFIFARVSVILKDISPLLAILLQVIFWSTPIVYAVPPSLRAVFEWHPLTAIIHLHRLLLTSPDPFLELSARPGLPGFTSLLALSSVAYFISSKRLASITGDEL